MIGTALRRLAVVGAAGFAYGLAEARAFQVRRVRVPVLPAGALPLRVLHVSDIHLLARQEYKLEFLRALAGLEPDLVITTGDNIAEAEALEPLLDAFGRLLDVPGGFVFGSNDYTSARLSNPLAYLARPSTRLAMHEPMDLPYHALREGLSARGWHDLNHARAGVELLGTTIELRGTDDAHLGLDDYSTVAGPPDPGAAVSLGVTHAPYARILDAMAADGVDLILAGHTHGGQVCVPGYGALTTNCDLDTAKAKGLSRHKVRGRSSWLHVSAGVGSSPFAPYRFACPPEVTVLTLAPGPNG